MSDIEVNTKLTAEKAFKMLKQEGVEITLEETEKILEFLRELANIAVSKHIENKDLNY